MDFGFASLMAMYANMHLREGAEPKKPADFMLDYLADRKAKKPKLTPDEEQAELLRVAQQIGAVVVDEDCDAEAEEMRDVDAYDEEQ